jgi:hypothetical protein
MATIEPEQVITYESRPTAALHFAVNFGVFTGRDATSHDLKRLAKALLALVPAAAIISEHRLEVDGETEALVHQVQVELDLGALADTEDVEVLRGRLADAIRDWADSCINGFSGAELTHAERAARDAVIEP